MFGIVLFTLAIGKYCKVMLIKKVFLYRNIFSEGRVLYSGTEDYGSGYGIGYRTIPKCPSKKQYKMIQ
jgi:hypothetical protein